MNRLSLKKLPLPKLFAGKRQSSDHEGNSTLHDGPNAKRNGAQDQSLLNDSRSSSLSASQASASGKPEPKKRTGNAEPVSFTASSTSERKKTDNAGQVDMSLPAPAPPPKDPQRRTFNVPQINLFGGNEKSDTRKSLNFSSVFTGESRKTGNSSAVPFSTLESSKPVSYDPPASIGSIETLDDFSLRRLLDKRLFDESSGFSETILVIRLSSASSNQLANSLNKVLGNTMLDKKRREIMVAFTRLPEICVHGVGASGGALGLTWSFPLHILLALREQKRGVMILQFAGGKERKILPLNEIERGWLIYCVSRLGREHAQCEPSVLAMSSLRVIANEETLNGRCPFLLKNQPSGYRPSKTTNEAGKATSDRKGDVSFGAVEFVFDDEDLKRDLAEEEAIAESFKAMRSLRNGARGSSLVLTSEDCTILDSVFAVKSDQPSTNSKGFSVQREEDFINDLVNRANQEQAQLEKATLNELRAWEAGEVTATSKSSSNGGIMSSFMSKKTLVELDHGRKNDPVASLLAHLEALDASLNELEHWMNDHDDQVGNITLVARRMDEEVRRAKEELDGKEKLAQHLSELLQTLSSEDQRILDDLSIQLPIVQRELETFQAKKTATPNLLRAIKQLLDLRKRGGTESKLLARRERAKEIEVLSQTVAIKLSDFIGSRIEYYYRFERRESAKDCHGRLAIYSELLGLVKALDSGAFESVQSKYTKEASAIIRGDLSHILMSEPYFTGISVQSLTPNSFPVDAFARYPEPASQGSLEWTSNKVSYERDLAIKEIQHPGLEARRRFALRLLQFMDEEDAFCVTMHGLNATPALESVLESLWSVIAHKTNHLPVSVVAPLLYDLKRLETAPQLNNVDKDARIASLKRFQAPMKECLERFLVDQVTSVLEKTKRSQQVFVRRIPLLVDRLWAATKGVGALSITDNNYLSEVESSEIQLLMEIVLSLIATLPSPLARCENLFVLHAALEARGEVLSGLVQSLHLDDKLQASALEAALNVLQTSPFAPSMALSRRAEEGEVLKKPQVDDVLAHLVADKLERAVLGIFATVEQKVSTVGARQLLMETARNQVVDSYWMLAEAVAEDLGITVVPNPSSVRDVWAKFVSS